MVFFNWATMQMAAKIVYYGPGLCGKTTNLNYIYQKTSPNSRGEMVSLETESDRTLFFDLLPIEVGTIGGFKTRLQLYTVPGQVFYNTTRKLVLKGVDGMVFVADSQRPMRDANIESFRSLHENLDELGLDFTDVPLVLQFNKRDLSGLLTVEELNQDLNPEGGYDYFESSAVNGDGVFETLKAITKQTLKKLRKRMAAPQPAPAPQPTASIRGPAVTAPPAPATPAPEPEPAPRPIFASALARAAEEGVGEELADSMAAPAAAAPAAVDLQQEPVVAEQPLPEPEPAPPPASEEPIEFDHSEPEPAQVLPMKRVQVSSQMDILAELDGLRKEATMGAGGKASAAAATDLDLDTLLTGKEKQQQELRHTISRELNSDIFQHMRALQVAIRVQNGQGETIHIIDPVSLAVEDANALQNLILQLTVDLENKS